MLDEAFDRIWRPARGFRRVSPQLEALVHALYAAVLDARRDVTALHAALESLLVFLASTDGRTDANCSVVDRFFTDDWWTDAAPLPDGYHDLLSDLGGALHDTIYAPQIAENFDSTPEQLLARLRALVK